jgi:hypothetical protein
MGVEPMMGLLDDVSPKTKVDLMFNSGRLTTVSPDTYWLVLALPAVLY